MEGKRTGGVTMNAEDGGEVASPPSSSWCTPVTLRLGLGNGLDGTAPQSLYREHAQHHRAGHRANHDQEREQHPEDRAERSDRAFDRLEEAAAGGRRFVAQRHPAEGDAPLLLAQ